MDALEAIAGRRSIRHFTDEPVSAGDIEKLLRAAMAAPSAGNQQSWRFIVVTHAEVLRRLAEATPYSQPVGRAPLAFVVCGDTAAEKHPGYWVQDCSAAVQNLLVAAHALQLGAVWIGVHPIEERERAVAEVCGIPEGNVPLAMIAVGHPAEDKPLVDRFDLGYVSVQQWGGPWVAHGLLE